MWPPPPWPWPRWWEKLRFAKRAEPPRADEPPNRGQELERTYWRMLDDLRELTRRTRRRASRREHESK